MHCSKYPKSEGLVARSLCSPQLGLLLLGRADVMRSFVREKWQELLLIAAVGTVWIAGALLWL
jgi:hypothetical protein